MTACTLIFLLALLGAVSSIKLEWTKFQKNQPICRRSCLHIAVPVAVTAATVIPTDLVGAETTQSTTPSTLRDILAARDATLLTKSFLNIPPTRQMYPAWLEGTWDCTETFRGYEFPSKVPKEKIVSRTSLPGFTKLSISRFADIGRQSTRYSLTFSLDDSGVVRESYADNIKASIEAHTDGREVVDGVDAR